MEAKEAYRFIRPVLVKMMKGDRHTGTLMPGVLRFLDEAWAYVDKNNPPERLGMELERIISVTLFVAECEIIQTRDLNHWVTAQRLYDLYFRWVGPKKLRTMNREQFVRTIEAVFPWAVGKANGRRTFFGIQVLKA